MFECHQAGVQQHMREFTALPLPVCVPRSGPVAGMPSISEACVPSSSRRCCGSVATASALEKLKACTSCNQEHSPWGRQVGDARKHLFSVPRAYLAIKALHAVHECSKARIHPAIQRLRCIQAIVMPASEGNFLLQIRLLHSMGPESTDSASRMVAAEETKQCCRARILLHGGW